MKLIMLLVMLCVLGCDDHNDLYRIAQKSDTGICYTIYEPKDIAGRWCLEKEKK